MNLKFPSFLLTASSLLSCTTEPSKTQIQRQSNHYPLSAGLQHKNKRGYGEQHHFRQYTSGYKPFKNRDQE